MSGLKVVCLISGGKDSLFSILHCLANGHEIVALANLHPPDDGGHVAVEDLDSYMYQTIGHSVIPLYGEALGLPLYRQAIIGSAVNEEKCYGPVAASQDDETEALMPLLRRVMTRHPEINAVSTGAILSDYQRTRVESVASRLGLTPLSYLWQYPSLMQGPQTSLLEDMAAVGQDSRIVKVASGGLDESFLWQNVAHPKTISRLDKVSKRFGTDNTGAVLGEGGEYETLAVAGPAPLWKGRIVVDDADVETVMGDAGSASVKPFKARFESSAAGDHDVQSLRIPALLEPRFQAYLDTSSTYGNAMEDVADTERNGFDDAIPNGAKENDSPDSQMAQSTLLSNVTGEGTSASEEMQSIMDTVKRKLDNTGKGFDNIAYTSIILRDMATFPDINSIYGRYFVYPNPPARATIACAGVLPRGKQVMVSFTFTKSHSLRTRKGLHVQSRSYWAPANIGPYSQAISVPIRSNVNQEAAELVYVAGQIPLVPASMELHAPLTDEGPENFLQQTVLALQHAARIGRVMQVKQWVRAIAFIETRCPATAASRSRMVHHALGALHREDDPTANVMEDGPDEGDAFDVWNIKYGSERFHSFRHQNGKEELTAKASLPSRTPSLNVIQVDALPKGAGIEWVLYGTTAEANFTHEIPHFDHLLSLFGGCIVEPQ